MAFYKISSITVNDTQGSVILTPSETVSLTNTDKICFKLFDAIPKSADNYPVFIFVNGVNTPIWDRYGNPALAKNVKKHKCYCGYYGSTLSHVIVDNLPRIFNCGNVGNII